MNKQQAIRQYQELNLAGKSNQDLYVAGWEAREAHLINAAHTIEPNWKEELAELRSRPETDPFQIAIAKIYNLLQGVADEELKSILCMAFWKQAIEPLVSALSPIDTVAHAIAFAKWLMEHGERLSTNPFIFNYEAAYKLFNPSGAATGKLNIETGYKKGFQGWTAFFTIGVQTFTLGDLESEGRAKWYKDQLDKAFANLSTPAPPAAGPVDYKGAIRQMMESTNKLLLTHLPQLSGSDRALAQVAVMDEFFAVFGRGTDLEELAEQYNKIKPSVL